MPTANLSNDAGQQPDAWVKYTFQAELIKYYLDRVFDFNKWYWPALAAFLGYALGTHDQHVRLALLLPSLISCGAAFSFGFIACAARDLQTNIVDLAHRAGIVPGHVQILSIVSGTFTVAHLIVAIALAYISVGSPHYFGVHN